MNGRNPAMDFILLKSQGGPAGRHTPAVCIDGATTGRITLLY
jgi:hypothetical protein